MKQQWYRSTFVKGILILLEHILAVLAVISFLRIFSYPVLRDEVLSGKPAEDYEETVSFTNQIRENAFSVLEGVRMKGMYETEGAYDPQKIVDIKEYQENSEISGENKSGLAYRLGELYEWGKDIYDGNDGQSAADDYQSSIIVCRKSDKTFHYYYYGEFKELINSGKLRFVIANDESGILEEDILSELRDGNFYNSSESAFKGLQDEEGKVVYIDCWNYDGTMLEERCRPIGADNLLQIVNENPEWNGRLNDAYSMLQSSLYRINDERNVYEKLDGLYQEGDTNFVYLYADTKSKQVYTNRQEYKNYGKLEKNLDSFQSLGKYIIVKPELKDLQSNIPDTDFTYMWNVVRASTGEKDGVVYAIGVDTGYPVKDEFYKEAQIYKKYGAGIHVTAALGLGAIVLFFVILAWLTVAAGRNNRDERLLLNWFDNWKTELAAGTVMAAWVIPAILLSFNIFSMSNAGYYQTDYMYRIFIAGGVAAAYTCALFLTGYLSLVKRIKARILWKNSILRILCEFMRQLFGNLQAVWKAVVIFGLFIMVHWITVLNRNRFSLLLMLIGEAAIFVYMVRQAIGRQQIDTGVEKIAGGEVDYKIPLESMGNEQRSIAEKINSIGQGLDAALAESVKSERLKTDLITNVSHDIKTPLTSIINYVELLKQENFEDPKIQRYLEVLEQKSQRLKTLTEDVVEASKVSSGNITLEYMNINLVEMIQQTSGEFEEKFSARDLKEVMTLPEQNVIVSADGRRMWRVLANIYNNAAKYAMEGTRIYADLYTSGNTAIFSLKNISEQPLNISADELTERFIRGDISRSTEGSGLGLSIARTLTEMQGGRFELYLDGDLFRVTITFPLI